MTDIGNNTGALSGERRELRSLNADEAGRILVEWGHKSYRVTQLLGWLYKKRAGSIDEMTDLPKALRATRTTRTPSTRSSAASEPPDSP